MNFQDENALTDLMNLFIDKCVAGADKLVPYALDILVALATIELALLLILSVLEDGEPPIYFLTKKLLKYGFFVWLIQNWATKMALTKEIFSFFELMGATAAGIKMNYAPGAIAYSGIEHAESIFQTIYGLGIGNMSTILIKGLLAIIILLCFAGVAIYMFITKIQFYIVATLTVVLLPFGANKFTSFLSEKAVGAIFSLGIKMMVLTFVCFLVGPFLAALDHKVTGGLTIPGIAQLLVGCAAMVYLTLTAPTLASDLLSGSPTMGDSSARGVANATKSAGGMAKSAVTGAMGGYGMIQAAANADGGRTPGGKIDAKGTAHNLGSILRQQMPDRQAQMQGKWTLQNSNTLKKEQGLRDAHKRQGNLGFD